MKNVMRWGTCALLLLFTVAFCPTFGQKALAQDSIQAGNVKGNVWTLTADTVLDLNTDLTLDTIVSDDYGLVIKGEGTLTLNGGISVKSLEIEEPLSIVQPEGGTVQDGKIVDGDGNDASSVVIGVKEAAPVESDDDGDEGVGEGAGEFVDGADDVSGGEGEGNGGESLRKAGENNDDNNANGNDAEKIVVTFAAVGKGTVAPKSAKADDEGLVEEPTATANDACHVLEGWYSDEGCTESFDFGDKVTESCTVYAKFTANHTVEKVAAKDATCTEDGNIACYQCSVCKGYFKTEAATDDDEILKSDVVIEAKGHSADHFTATSATCTKSGNVEYWHCSRCDRYFNDANLTNAITRSQTVIKPLGHELTHVEANDATCTKSGNVEYWHCSRCDRYFTDATAKTAIKKSSTVISKTGHNWGAWKVIKQATTKAKGQEKRVCKNNSAHVQTRDTPMLIAYTFTKGADSTWTKGSKNGLEMNVKRNTQNSKTYSLLKGVSIDDKVIDPKNYTAAKGKKGGLKLTFKQSYLQSLTAAKHNIKVSFQDGDAVTTLTIKDNSKSKSSGSSTPSTGDSIRVGIVVGIVVIAIIAAVGVIIARRRMS